VRKEEGELLMQNETTLEIQIQDFKVLLTDFKLDCLLNGKTDAVYKMNARLPAMLYDRNVYYSLYLYYKSFNTSFCGVLLHSYQLCVYNWIRSSQDIKLTRTENSSKGTSWDMRPCSLLEEFLDVGRRIILEWILER
jgi:hypothetical protein